MWVKYNKTVTMEDNVSTKVTQYEKFVNEVLRKDLQ